MSSRVIRFGVLLLLIISCHSQEPKVASPAKGEAPYFSPTQVVSALNALVAIVDWPEDTSELQKKLNVTPESARKLVLPLHPLYDQKVDEVAAQLSSWTTEKRTETFTSCSKNCECDFYREVFDRHPELKEKFGKEFKNQDHLKDIDRKKKIISCLQSLPDIDQLLAQLQSEAKDYEAPAAL